jgi:hypothetical protein
MQQSRSLVRTHLSASPSDLFREFLKFHQLLETLVHCETQVFANQSNVNVFFISIDYSVSTC